MKNENASCAPVDEEFDRLNDCDAATSNGADSEERQFLHEDDQTLGALFRAAVLALLCAVERILKDDQRGAEELKANGGSDD